MEQETQTIDTQVIENEAREEGAKGERQRLAELKAAFPDDLEFAMKAFSEGRTVTEAKAEYCDVLREKEKQREQQGKEKASDGAEPVKNDDSDDESGQDFLIEARKLADEKKITMTEAMKRVRRRNPELHEAFKARCKAEGPACYN